LRSLAHPHPGCGAAAVAAGFPGAPKNRDSLSLSPVGRFREPDRLEPELLDLSQRFGPVCPRPERLGKDAIALHRFVGEMGASAESGFQVAVRARGAGAGFSLGSV